MPKPDDEFLKESALLNADPKLVQENLERLVKATTKARPASRRHVVARRYRMQQEKAKAGNP
jgi:hypothetical protein